MNTENLKKILAKFPELSSFGFSIGSGTGSPPVITALNGKEFLYHKKLPLWDDNKAFLVEENINLSTVTSLLDCLAKEIKRKRSNSIEWHISKDRIQVSMRDKKVTYKDKTTVKKLMDEFYGLTYS